MSFVTIVMLYIFLPSINFSGVSISVDDNRKFSDKYLFLKQIKEKGMIK